MKPEKHPPGKWESVDGWHGLIWTVCAVLWGVQMRQRC